jgi:hypothetical protein
MTGIEALQILRNGSVRLKRKHWEPQEYIESYPHRRSGTHNGVVPSFEYDLIRKKDASTRLEVSTIIEDILNDFMGDDWEVAFEHDEKYAKQALDMVNARKTLDELNGKKTLLTWAEASAAMKHGKFVRRSGWDYKDAMTAKDNGRGIWSTYGTDGYVKYRSGNFIFEDVLATDWEVLD